MRPINMWGCGWASSSAFFFAVDGAWGWCVAMVLLALLNLGAARWEPHP